VSAVQSSVRLAACSAKSTHHSLSSQPSDEVLSLSEVSVALSGSGVGLAGHVLLEVVGRRGGLVLRDVGMREERREGGVSLNRRCKACKKRRSSKDGVGRGRGKARKGKGEGREGDRESVPWRQRWSAERYPKPAGPSAGRG
jgi:hypothetical protein